MKSYDITLVILLYIGVVLNVYLFLVEEQGHEFLHSMLFATEIDFHVQHQKISVKIIFTLYK